MSGNTQLWGSSVQVGCASVAGATKALWYPALLDPNSMRFNTEGILAYGESGQLSGLQVGPPGAWFYPPY